ncbi:putative AC9 transposase [Bienertia sinuspersici]
MESPNMDSPIMETPIAQSPMESNIQVIESDDEVNNATPTQPSQKKTKKKPNLSGNPLKRQRKLTSSVWDHFVMIDELDSLGRMQSKCMKCDAKYIAESSHGTGNMLRHIRSCKGKVYRDIDSVESDMDQLCTQVLGMTVEDDDDDPCSSKNECEAN